MNFEKYRQRGRMRMEVELPYWWHMVRSVNPYSQPHLILMPRPFGAMSFPTVELPKSIGIHPKTEQRRGDGVILFLLNLRRRRSVISNGNSLHTTLGV